MNRQDLMNTFMKARGSGAEYIFVAVKLPDLEIPEMIVNRKENFDSKERYYLMAYDENLVHYHNKEISIVGLSYGDLDEIKNIYQ